MQTADPIRHLQPVGFPWRAAGPIVVAAAVLLQAPATFAQESVPKEQARVPTSYANVHAEPSSGSVPLVLVPRGTVLPVIGRRGEWVQVRLASELRQTGMVMRWYEGRHEIIRRGVSMGIGDENSGWMHDSTVEITEVGAP